MNVRDIAHQTLTRISPEAGRQEIAWLLYKTEMDFQQDITDRPEVYRQAVQDALPTLPKPAADFLSLLWEDCEERLALHWGSLEPPNPEREAELQRQRRLLTTLELEMAWHRAVRAPHDPIEEADYETMRKIVRAMGVDITGTSFDVLWEEIHANFRSGMYDDYLEQRGAGQWPDVTIRRPSKMFANWGDFHD